MTLVKKRVSKKTKGSWRKIEHEDVENFLEDQRLEERTGKVSDKSNDELFIIDTAPAPVNKKKKGFSSLREKREKLRNSIPRSLLGLQNTSKVQDPITKRNRVRTKEERKHFIAKSIDAQRAEKGIVKQSVLRALSDRARSLETSAAKRSVNKQVEFVKDIWNETPKTEKAENFKNEWVSKKVQTYHMVNNGIPVVSVPSSAYHKRSKIKTIETPHPGTSYNPTLEDHQALLEEVKVRELKIIKRQEHLDRVTTSMYKKVTAEERDKNIVKELGGDIDDDDDIGSDVSSDDDPNEYVPVNPPVENKRKDRKARRKQRQQLELQKATLKKKLEKKQRADLHRLKQIKAEIKEMEAHLEDQRTKKIEREEKKREEPHRLSQFEYEDPEIDVNMPEEISGNLRNIVPQGSILIDRYKSMQRRNIIATSKDLGLRKRREIKRYVRKTHKEEPTMPVKTKKRKKKNQA